MLHLDGDLSYYLHKYIYVTEIALKLFNGYSIATLLALLAF